MSVIPSTELKIKIKNYKNDIRKLKFKKTKKGKIYKNKSLKDSEV